MGRSTVAICVSELDECASFSSLFLHSICRDVEFRVQKYWISCFFSAKWNTELDKKEHGMERHKVQPPML